MNIQKRKDLIKFIDFHAQARSFSQNSIQAITSGDNIKDELVDIFNFLKKDVEIVEYKKGAPTKFIENLLWVLHEGKVALVVTNTLDFEPVVYDQLLQLRERNKFTLSFANTVPVSPVSSIFLFYRTDKNDKRIFAIADHILRLQKTH